MSIESRNLNPIILAIIAIMSFLALAKDALAQNEHLELQLFDSSYSTGDSTTGEPQFIFGDNYCDAEGGETSSNSPDCLETSYPNDSTSNSGGNAYSSSSSSSTSSSYYPIVNSCYVIMKQGQRTCATHNGTSYIGYDSCKKSETKCDIPEGQSLCDCH